MSRILFSQNFCVRVGFDLGITGVSRNWFYLLTTTWMIYNYCSKIEVPRDVRNSKSENKTSSGENGLNIRANASLKGDRTKFSEE